MIAEFLMVMNEVIEREYQASRYDEDKWEAAEQALRAFKARMDAKYGNP